MRVAQDGICAYIRGLYRNVLYVNGNHSTCSIYITTLKTGLWDKQDMQDVLQCGALHGLQHMGWGSYI